MSSNIIIHSPNSNTLHDFDVDAFMGKWHVTHSTLPLWKNKKDVSITYTAIEGVSDPCRFNDLVEYRSATAAADSNPSRVVGVDTHDVGGAARYKWRGKGWLMIASSRWQVIGYGDGWAVTYFQKTLFTPAGLDIYARNPGGLEAGMVDEIMAKAKAVGGEVGQLAGQFFEVQLSTR